jgi:hypothetical protein
MFTGISPLSLLFVETFLILVDFLCSGIFVSAEVKIRSFVPSFVQIDYVPAAEQGVDLTVTYQDASPAGIRTSVDRVASVGVIQVSTQSLPEDGVLYITVRDQDINVNPNEIERLSVVCSTGKVQSGNFDSKTVILTSTAANSNIFTGNEVNFISKNDITYEIRISYFQMYN